MHQYPWIFAIDAGRHMVSEAETRAVLDYVLKHENIAAMLTFGESDNLIAAAPRASAISLLDFVYGFKGTRWKTRGDLICGR